MKPNRIEGPSRSLREAQKELTRKRIRDAAKHVLSARGYAATTLDEVAIAAGVQRSTLYAHFRNKEDILGAIADEYLDHISTVIEKIPSPFPTRDEVDTWIRQFIAFIAEHKVPTMLVVDIGGASEIPSTMVRFGEKLMKLFADRLPAFAKASDTDEAGLFARAEANMVVRELGWSARYYIDHDGQALTPQVLSLTSDLFCKFVGAERANTKLHEG